MWDALHLVQPLKTAESYKCYSEYEVIEDMFDVRRGNRGKWKAGSHWELNPVLV